MGFPELVQPGCAADSLGGETLHARATFPHVRHHDAAGAGTAGGPASPEAAIVASAY